MTRTVHYLNQREILDLCPEAGSMELNEEKALDARTSIKRMSATSWYMFIELPPLTSPSPQDSYIDRLEEPQPTSFVGWAMVALIGLLGAVALSVIITHLT